MDIEIDEIPSTQTKANTRALPIDDNHPFDLDSYVSSYAGRSLVDRLIFLIPLCPSLAVQATQIASSHIRNMRDTNLYTALQSAYAQAAAAAPQDNPLPDFQEVSDLDQDWVTKTNKRNNEERTKLEVELKTYSSNMIKESIRMAHRDLASFFRATGDYPSALRNLNKVREYCTTSQHVLEMCLVALEALVEQRNYAQIPTYVFKAEPALDAVSNFARGGGGAPNTATQSTRDRAHLDREKLQSKLDIASGIAHLASGSFEKAAQSFLKVGRIPSLQEWAKIISPSDIATYATLCALATFSRTAIKAQVLENDTFSAYIEQEPYIREMLEAYMSSKFKTVLEILERNSTRHAVSPHLYHHLAALTQLIRSRAIVLYFQPFASVKLEKMAKTFGWTIDETEVEVVRLIRDGREGGASGGMKGRVDRLNKILKAQEVDQRAELFARAMKAGADIQSTNRKLLLRLRLQQADLVVKAPKQQQQQQQQQQQSGAYPSPQSPRVITSYNQGSWQIGGPSDFAQGSAY